MAIATSTGESGQEFRRETAFAEALRRAQGEFLEMPGLQLTEDQAARLWACDAALCQAILEELVARRFLVRTRHSRFTRVAT